MAPVSRVHELRERVGQWAARHHEAELLAGMRCHLGPDVRRPSADNAQAALAFAILSPPTAGPSIVERYAVEVGGASRSERAVLDAWGRTWFSALRITDVEVDRSVEVHDVVRDVVVRVRERSATHQLSPGDWMVAGYFADDGHTAFEGTMMLVPPIARIHVVKAALQELERLGVTGDRATPADSRRLARPMVEAVHRGVRPPRFVNADGHDVVLVTSTLDVTWRKLRDVVRRWPDAEPQRDHVDVFGVELVEHVSGPVMRATFRHDDGVVTLFTNSRERHEAIATRWAETTGKLLPVAKEDVQRPPSNPDGEPMIVDAQAVPIRRGERLADVQRRALQGARRDWVDEPIPALDGLTPREAVEGGRRAEVWALLPDETVADALGLVAGRKA